MKTILLWDPRFPGRPPQRLMVEDAIASAAVRAGVAAANDPSEMAGLMVGGPIDPADLTPALIQTRSGRLAHVMVPATVLQVAANLGLGASLGRPFAAAPAPPPTPIWNRSDALVLDYRNNRFSKSGTILADEAALLTAMRGGDPYAVATVTGVKREFGSFVDAGITEEMTDPSFETGAGWTVTQSSGGPATFAAVGGEGQLTGNGSTNPAVSQQYTTALGKAYRAVAHIKRGAGSSAGAKIVVSDTASLSAAVAQTGLVPSTSDTEYVLTWSAIGAAVPLSVGMLTQGGAVAGYNAALDISVKECLPFAGAQQGAMSAQLEFRADAADLTGTKVLLSYDSGAFSGSAAAPYERSFARIACVNGVLRCEVFYETARGNIGQQTIIPIKAGLTEGRHKLQLAITAGFVALKIDDDAPITQSIDYLPGVAYMRIHGGMQATSQNWSNADTIVTHYNSLTMPDGVNPAIYGVYGDSYHGIAAYIGKAMTAVAQDKGVGGRTLALINSEQVQVSPQLWGKPAALWDGKPNGYTTLADYIATMNAILARHGANKLVVIGYCKTIPGSAENGVIDEANAWAAANIPNWIDPHPTLLQLGNGSANDNADIAAGCVPRSLLDNIRVHVLGPGYAALASGPIKTKLLAIT